MVDKTAYIKKFKEIYRQKNNAEIPDELALDYFENLTSLVSAITEHVPLDEIIVNETRN